MTTWMRLLCLAAIGVLAALMAGGPVSSVDAAAAGVSSTASKAASVSPDGSGWPSVPTEAPMSPSSQIGAVVGAIVGSLVVIGAVVTIVVATIRRSRLLPPDDATHDEPGGRG